MIEKHVARHGHKPIVPTVSLMRYWWAKLNHHLFGGELMPCQLEVIDCMKTYTAVGLCWPLESRRVRISLHTEFDTRAGFLSALAHEMIHQFQHQNDLPLNHGREFDGWRTFILHTTGLEA
jgi:hypothetical protein